MAALAQMIVSNEQNIDKVDLLGPLIVEALERGDDDAFEEAFGTINDLDAHEFFSVFLNECIDVQTFEGALEEEIELHLFALPLVIVVDNTGEDRLAPEGVEGTIKIAETLRAHGLVGAEPSTLMLPHLYTLQDLFGLTPSQSFKFGHELFESVMKEGEGEEEEEMLPRSAPVEIGSGQSAVLLRFLVGAVIAVGGSFDGCELLEEHGDYNNWIEAVSEEISSDLERNDLTALAMCQGLFPMHESLSVGTFQHQMFSTTLMLKQLMLETPPELLDVGLEPLPEGEGIGFLLTVSNKETGAALERFPWQVLSPVEVELIEEALPRMLVELGIEQAAEAPEG